MLRWHHGATMLCTFSVDNWLAHTAKVTVHAGLTAMHEK